MRYIRRLFDEGLIDPMSFTADKAQLRALANGETCMVGMMVGMVSMGTANTQRIAEYVGIEPFKNKEGVRLTAFSSRFWHIHCSKSRAAAHVKIQNGGLQKYSIRRKTWNILHKREEYPAQAFFFRLPALCISGIDVV